MSRIQHTSYDEPRAYSTFNMQRSQQSSHLLPHSPTSPPNMGSPSQYLMNSLSVDNSKNILSRVFDEDLSVHSPSKQKQLKLLGKQYSRLEESPTQTRGNIDRINSERFANYHADPAPFIYQSDRLRKSYEDLRKSDEFLEVEDLPAQEQAVKYTQCLRSDSKDVRLAALQGLYDILSSEPISQQIKDIVLQDVLQSIERHDEQDLDFLQCAFDILQFFGQHPDILDRLPLFAALIHHDETIENDELPKSALACVARLGIGGLDVLVRLAGHDDPYFQQWVLDKLSLSNEVQKLVIVPALIQDAMSTNPKVRTMAVAALNRMYGLVWEGGALPVLLTLMQEGTVDRQLIACTIRSCGKLGEHTLIKLIKQAEDPKVRMAAASVLCWRVPTIPKQLDIVVVPDNVMIEDQLFPGSLCTYVGPTTPVVFEEEEIQDCCLQVYCRDFLAALQRIIRQDDKSIVWKHQPIFPEPHYEQPEEGKISIEAINGLCHALKDEFEGVRETATYALGFIGLPEAADAVESLSRVLFDQAPQVRTMGAWALGRLGPAAWQVAGHLVTLLKDGYWKVRTAACISLASCGKYVAKKAIPILMKIMQDASINRSTVAETIVRLGVAGEKTLVNFLTENPHTSIKIRLGMIKALSQSNTNNNHIDFVVELLFKIAQDRSPAARKEALGSLYELSQVANGQVTYLRPRTLLPLFFKSLKDTDQEVRNSALSYIVQSGPQGQLMLIEGLTKDTSHNIRAQCARGLGKFGAKAFRTLLLSLHDNHPTVRRAAAKSIVHNCSPQDISEEFWEKIPQRQSIKCAIKEIMNLPYPISQSCLKILQEILNTLEDEFMEGGRGYSYMETHPELRSTAQFSQEKEDI